MVSEVENSKIQLIIKFSTIKFHWKVEIHGLKNYIIVHKITSSHTKHCARVTIHRTKIKFIHREKYGLKSLHRAKIIIHRGR